MRLKMSEIGIIDELPTPTRSLLVVEFVYHNMEDLSKEYSYS